MSSVIWCDDLCPDTAGPLWWAEWRRFLRVDKDAIHLIDAKRSSSSRAWLLWRLIVYIWVFPKIGARQNGWFIMETLSKWMIWGYPYFRKHPYIIYFCKVQISCYDFSHPYRTDHETEKGRNIARVIAVSSSTAQEKTFPNPKLCSIIHYHNFQHLACNSTAKPADPPDLMTLDMHFPCLPDITTSNCRVQCAR